MKLKRVVIGATVGVVSLFAGFAVAQPTVDTAYLNFSDSPASSDCGGYCFGSLWGLGAVKVTVVGSTVTLQPNFNTYADNPGNGYWQNGAAGNKLTEANVFGEIATTPAGQDTFEFNGTVDAFTLDPDFYTATGVADYNVSAYVKIDPAGAAVTERSPVSAAGTFSVSIDAKAAAGKAVQYGFTLTGLNANPADEAALGSVVFTIAKAEFVPIPTNPDPDAIPALPLGALLGLIGLVGWLGIRRRV